MLRICRNKTWFPLVESPGVNAWSPGERVKTTAVAAGEPLPRPASRAVLPGGTSTTTAVSFTATRAQVGHPTLLNSTPEYVDAYKHPLKDHIGRSSPGAVQLRYRCENRAPGSTRRQCSHWQRDENFETWAVQGMLQLARLAWSILGLSEVAQWR